MPTAENTGLSHKTAEDELGVAVQIMAKGGLDAVTRALAIEYAKDGIRVNTVALGVIKTPMHRPETYEFFQGLDPIGRMGERSRRCSLVPNGRHIHHW
jgi:NAD(P)-dependent dehydrogenase (short-subunit alcohol dehydrogenase family)